VLKKSKCLERNLALRERNWALKKRNCILKEIDYVLVPSKIWKRPVTAWRVWKEHLKSSGPEAIEKYTKQIGSVLYGVRKPSPKLDWVFWALVGYFCLSLGFKSVGIEYKP
jgi:hypothetical protein